MLSKKSYFILTLLVSVLLLTALLQLDGGQGLTGEKIVAASESATEADSTQFLPMIMKRYDPRFPGPLFGVQIYGRTDTENPYHPYLVGSQASWVRSRIIWEFIEPEHREPPVYGWAWADVSLAGALSENGGMNVIAVIEEVPEWARLIPSSRSGPIHPDALDDFAVFVAAAAERYDGDGIDDAPGHPIINHWELFNEPDSNTNRWGGYGANYAAMLKVAYPAIKAANPNAHVLFGGLAYDWFDYQGGPFDSSFLDDVLANGGGSYFDVMNFHLYPAFAPTWGSASTGLKEKTANIRAKLANYGLEKPIFITEAGWHSSTDFEPASDDQEQIARLMQFFTQSYAADIKVLIWWMLNDPGGFFADYGLVTLADGSPPAPKPSYTAYQTAVSKLSESQYIGELGPNVTGVETMEVYQFRNNQGNLYVAWNNPYDSAGTVPLVISAEELVVLDGLGNTLGSLTDGNGDGRISVNITDQPIYIQVIR